MDKVTPRNALIAIVCLGASLYFSTVAHWERLILDNGSLLLVMDSYSWFDFYFAILESGALLSMGLWFAFKIVRQ